MRLVPDLLERGVRRAPERAAVVQGDVQRSFADVHRRAAGAVEMLRGAGVAAGDRVLFLAANEPEFLELQVACQRLGAVFVPVNFRLAAAELAAIVADCRPALLVHSAAFDELAAGLEVPARWCLTGPDAATSYGGQLDQYLAVAGDAVPAWAPIAADATAQLLYTSGTTGVAKGAVTSNGALFARIAAFVASHEVDEEDVFLQTLPLFHLACLVSFAFTAAGATCVTVQNPEPDLVLRTIADSHVTQLLTVPTIIAGLVARQADKSQDLSGLRNVFYGASPIQPSALTRAMSTLGCGFTQLYGMTEAGIAVAMHPADHDPVGKPDRLVAAGRDMLFYRTDVVRPDGSPAGTDEVGEITISGPGLFSEYWGNPSATAQAVRDGRLHTGDAGYRRADGFLVLTDRIKDMIISGGENVYAREVETALLEHPSVADVAVIGLPDDRWGERVHAVVVHAGGLDTDGVDTGELDTDELDDWCRSRIAAYKRPRSYETIAELPRNAVGKVVKHVLRSERTGVPPS